MKWGSWLTSWVLVIGAAATATTAFFLREHHQQLALSYNATARQLKLLKGEWLDNHDPTGWKFIARCETVIANENKIWMDTTRPPGIKPAGDP